MILVTGAGGKTGRALIQCLAARGQSVRGLVRNRDLGQLISGLGAQEAVIADMQDPIALAETMHGIRSVYHVCPNMHPQELEIGEWAISAAQQAGVEHFVFHSVLHPQVESMPHHWSKMRVEEKLFRSGMGLTVLQPAPYMQNLDAWLPRILEEGYFEVPYAAKTKLNLIDLHDLAEAAATVLEDPKYRYGTYELCGPENLSQTEVAGILAKCLERKVEVKVTSLDMWSRQARKNGFDEYAIGVLTKMFTYYDQNDLVGNSQALESILGRPPSKLTAFVRRGLLA